MTLPSTLVPWRGGEVPSAAKLEAMRETQNFLLRVPAASLMQATGTAVATSTLVQIAGLTTVEFDTDGMTGTANQITIQTPGLYAVTGVIAWPANSAGNRIVYLYRNGAAMCAHRDSPGGTVQWTMQAPVYYVRCVAGDALTLHGYQTSGATLTTVAGYTHLQAWWIGE